MGKDKQHKARADRLTEKQEKFCQYYLDTEGNASEAYRMAYDAANMQPGTVWSTASILFANPKVSARIDEIREERRAASEPERKKVERVLMDIITSDPNDLYLVDPKTGRIKMKAPSQLPKRTRNALKKIKNSKGVVEYEFNGKVEAARLLGAWNAWDAPKEVNVNANGSLSPDNIQLIIPEEW